MMFGKKVILLTASILAVSLWGCSSGFDAENAQTSNGSGTNIADSSLIGAGNCIGCHQDASLSTTASPQVIADYLAGKHVLHSTHVDATATCALQCHDPLGDGRSLENFIVSGAPYDPTLLANPPIVSGNPVSTEADYLSVNGLLAVTCETCHGAGGDHPTSAANIPMPYKIPDYDRCGQCHNADFFHDTHGHTPEEDNIVEDYKTSKHFSGAVRNQAVCVKCHTDEGAKLYRTTDTAVALATTTAGTTGSKIQCRTCHNPHNNSLLLEAADANGSAEYNTCTNCHQRHDAQVGASITQVGSAADGSSGQLIFHAGSWDRVISSTHYDNPATTNKVEGYAINPLNERACRDCHNVHGADATINKQWASSAHGSKIRDAKEAAAAIAATPIDQVTAVRAAGADNTHALPHYDWDDTGGWNGSARGACQMCHTATGAKNFLTDQVNYDLTGAGNDFSHLSGWVDGVSSSGQNELIYCWACHSDNSGTLRNPGAVTIRSYTVSSANPIITDLGKSNVCVNCHSGRGNFDSHTNAYYTMTGDPTTNMSHLSPGGYADSPTKKNVTKTHYFAANATIFQALTKIGYEYPGVSYADKTYYAHKRIGLNSDTPETGSGPCAACHMAAKDHNLDVVEKTANVITAIKGTICVTCHTGQHALFVAQSQVGTTQNIWNGSAAVPTVVTQQMATDAATELEHEAEGFHEALDILQAELLVKGLTFGGYPYFSGPSWINEGTFGAALNFNYLHHEPGAYAHNRYYTKRLIFDSIDWLDNGVLDGTIASTIGNYPAKTYAATWLGSGTKRP